jgi:hypothetical protein
MNFFYLFGTIAIIIAIAFLLDLNDYLKKRKKK